MPGTYGDFSRLVQSANRLADASERLALLAEIEGRLASFCAVLLRFCHSCTLLCCIAQVRKIGCLASEDWCVRQLLA